MERNRAVKFKLIKIDLAESECGIEARKTEVAIGEFGVTDKMPFGL